MATPTRRKSTPPTPKPRVPSPEVEVVDPSWLLKALGFTVVAALLCAYLTLCLLVYQGQWQLVLHPVSAPTKTEPSPALPFEPVRFGATESGQPRLAGWWIPAAPGAVYAADTVLFLHGGAGNLDNDVEPLKALHGLGINVFAFDYRGFGASDPTHPTEQRMQEDSTAALDYLVDTRHIPIQTVVPYGVDLGAALAVTLAAAHGALPAVVVEDAVPDVLRQARGDARGGLVPLGLIFNQRFEIVSPLSTLKTPKLLLTGGPSPIAKATQPESTESAYRQAATPKYTVDLSSSQTLQPWTDAMHRFLDEYVSGKERP